METANHDLRKRRWWLPSVSLAIWLAFFLALNLSSWRLVLINADGDTCMHWRIGNWMIEHREVIRADQFSHTRPGAPVVTMEWLSEVIFAALGNSVGWPGLILLSGLLIATTLWLLHRHMVAEGDDLLVSTALVLLAASACLVHWWARPHLFTHLLVVIWAWQLRGFERDRVSAHQLFVRFVPLMVIWVNLHAGFLVGLMLIAMYFVGMAFRAETRTKMLPLGLLGVTCFFASLLNPNGWRLHKYIVDFLGHPNLVRSVSEFQSPNFHETYLLGYVALLAVLGVTLIGVRLRLRATDMLLLGVWGCFSLHSVRNVPIFALVATPILAEYLTVWVRSAGDKKWTRWWQRISARAKTENDTADGAVWVALAALTVELLVVAPQFTGGQPLLQAGILSERFPVRAVRYLATHPEARPQGEVFNWYRWGGYMLWVWPHRKVFVDGRNDFYGPALIDEYLSVNDVKPNWEKVLEKYNVGWTLLPTEHPLNAVLALRKDWRLVYQDEVATVYMRVAP